jgi:hypothetical protein
LEVKTASYFGAENLGEEASSVKSTINQEERGLLDTREVSWKKMAARRNLLGIQSVLPGRAVDPVKNISQAVR